MTNPTFSRETLGYADSITRLSKAYIVAFDAWRAVAVHGTPVGDTDQRNKLKDLKATMDKTKKELDHAWEMFADRAFVDAGSL